MNKYPDGLKRCFGESGDTLMMQYHDEEWGRPVHDERDLFELLSLEVFQAGLSWRTVLHKREAFRLAFHGFNPDKVSIYTETDQDRLLADAGIIRNKLKIAATINNAQKFLRIQQGFGSFDHYIWQFTEYQTLRIPRISTYKIPASTMESDNMSTDLKKLGFRFVGTKICYAFMQACGMVDDHVVDCFESGNSLP